MFGSTLALKGAIEEQQELAQEFGHCEGGCCYCETEALHSFERWVLDNASLESLLSLNDFQARVLDHPAMQALAKRIDDELINDLKFMAGDRWPKEYTIHRGNVPLEFNVIQRSEPIEEFN